MVRKTSHAMIVKPGKQGIECDREALLDFVRFATAAYAVFAVLPDHRNLAAFLERQILFCTLGYVFQALDQFRLVACDRKLGSENSDSLGANQRTNSFASSSCRQPTMSSYGGSGRA